MTYEIIDHGSDHAQFFPGCGVAFTSYTHVVTGAGSSVREAGEDALEQFWMTIEKDKLSVAEAEALEAEIKALSEEADAHDNCDPFDHEECEWSHYVSIRWRY